MTIGIGATGPQAGLAVFRALAAAESVGSGAIGGFAVFAAIGSDGRLYHAATQRGGTRTLFTEGESTGVEPPAHIAQAPFAAVMSSGPDRPEPLSQFLAAGASGLITGHRLPNTPGADGVPVNEAVLSLMAGGVDAKAALATVLLANPEVDAGMIALGPGRGLAALNSALVAARPDLGTAHWTDGAGTAVAVLHNAIRPAASLAPLVAAVAAQVLAPAPVPAGHAIIRAGTELTLRQTARVVVDANGVALKVEVTNPLFLNGRHTCAAVYLGTTVVHDGAVLGHTTVEPNVLIEDARILRMSGQEVFSIPYVK